MRTLNYSRQREAIYQVVQECPDHPTADTICERVRRQYPQISLGTVYRNLNQLAEAGVLLKVAMPAGSDRFDARLDEHYHMVCTCCRQVSDVDLLVLSIMDREIQERAGFRVTGRHMVLEGVCKACDRAVS